MGEFPSKTHQFPVNRRDHTKKGPYLLPLLKKFLKKKIKYEDPETQKIIQGRVEDAIVWRLILNATQGDNQAIKEIFERTDGKVSQKSTAEEAPSIETSLVELIKKHNNNSNGFKITRQEHPALDKHQQK